MSLDPERLWASNGFDRLRTPARGCRRRMALVAYWLALGTFFAAGLWALFID
jgi:hypothetical protein